jgi:hypothetical protein
VTRISKQSRQVLAVLILILLFAATLRWFTLPSMTDMLGYDESYYAADAASLLDNPRLTPFFSGNNGRESGWMYLLAAFMLGLGKTAFAARLLASFVGILAVAAIYRLSRELFGARIGDRIGVWAAMATVVLYWPFHFSHIAMRAILLPLLGALGLALLLAAWRTNRLRCWIACGLVVGATAYSYLSAQLWIALEVSILLLWVVTNRRLRRGAAVALLLVLMLASPMVIYVIEHPGESLLRAQQSATLGAPALEGAVAAWVNAWFTRGDILLNHNIPGRPILDWPMGLLFIVGLIGLPFVARPFGRLRAGWRVVLVLTLAFISIAPSLLSEYPPHFLRSIGLIVPIALVLGVGAELLMRVVSDVWSSVGRRWAPSQSSAPNTMLKYAALAPVGLFLVSAAITLRDFHDVWLNLPGISDQFLRPFHQAVRFVAQARSRLPADSPIYFTPFELTHPAIQFSRPALSPHRLGAFKNQTCLVVPISQATYITLPPQAPEVSDALSAWGELTTLAQAANDENSQPAFAVFELTPSDGLLFRPDDWVAQFGDAIELRTSQPSTTTIRSGEQLALTWQVRMRALRPLDRPYSLFVHLYKIDQTGAADDKRKWAQGDQQMCASYPTTIWQPDEVAVQTYFLVPPPGLPEGEYVIAVGLYDSESGTQLDVMQPLDRSRSSRTSYVVLQHLRVSR